MNNKGYANPQLLISAEELMNRVDNGSTCIVDTRPTHEYIAGHIRRCYPSRSVRN